MEEEASLLLEERTEGEEDTGIWTAGGKSFRIGGGMIDAIFNVEEEGYVPSRLEGDDGSNAPIQPEGTRVPERSLDPANASLYMWMEGITIPRNDI